MGVAAPPFTGAGSRGLRWTTGWGLCACVHAHGVLLVCDAGSWSVEPCQCPSHMCRITAWKSSTGFSCAAGVRKETWRTGCCRCTCMGCCMCSVLHFVVCSRARAAHFGVAGGRPSSLRWLAPSCSCLQACTTSATLWPSIFSS